MKCNICGTYNGDELAFCSFCGASLTPADKSGGGEKYCSFCKKTSPASSLFCGYCGRKLTGTAESPDNEGPAPMYVLNMVDKYVGDIMIGISQSGGILKIFSDRIEYHITRSGNMGSMAGVPGQNSNSPSSGGSGTVETYRYNEMEGCYVSNYLNSMPGMLFVLKDGTRFKFVCVFGSYDPNTIICTINGFIDKAKRQEEYQYQAAYPWYGQQMSQPIYQQPGQYQQPMTPQPVYPLPTAQEPPQPMPPQPVYPLPTAQEPQPMPPQPVYPLPTAQEPQPMPPQPVYPLPTAQEPQPMPPQPVYPQYGQGVPPMPPQPVYPQYGQGLPPMMPQPVYPQYGQNVPPMQPPVLSQGAAQDKYGRYSFVMEISGFIRVDEQYVAILGAVRKGNAEKGTVLNVISSNGLDKGSFEVKSIAVNKAISENAAAGDEDTAFLCVFSPSLIKAGDIACGLIV